MIFTDKILKTYIFAVKIDIFFPDYKNNSCCQGEKRG